MVAWWWIPIAWVVGALMELMTVIICMGGDDKNKKAADAGTSTADREPVRKDYFL